MVSEDIESLRRFGDEVKKKRNEKEKRNLKQKSRMFPSIICKKGVHAVRGSKLFFQRVCDQLKASFKSFLYHRHQKRYTFTGLNTPQFFTNQSKTSKKKILVEYQKQFGDISIIIRRRKKIYPTRKPVDSNQLSYKYPAAYYFHHIDLTEKNNHYRFLPQPSIWDFHYSSKSVVERVKQFLRF